jgi:hypothetical protein
MAFPLTHRGKLEFPLRNSPEITSERFYEDASFKLERSFAIDAAVEVTTSDNKLIVSYTVNFKKILVIISVFILVAFGIYFSTWDLVLPPGLPLSRNPSGVRVPPTITHILAVMGFYWLWFFGGIYVITIARFRSLLRDTWKELRLS